MRTPRNSEVVVAYEVTVLRFHQIVPSLSLSLNGARDAPLRRCKDEVGMDGSRPERGQKMQPVQQEVISWHDDVPIPLHRLSIHADLVLFTH